MIDRTAVILCGGKGTRLGLLGKKAPKTLLKVHGKPILWYIIKFLQKNSFNHFILPVGFKGKKITKYINKEKTLKKLNIKIINTGENTSISQRIHKIIKFIKSENFILLNGDAIFNFNIKKIYLDHLKQNNIVTFLGSHALMPYGVVGTKGKKIISFSRDTKFNAIISQHKKKFIGYIYSGISLMNKKILKSNFKSYKNFEKKFYPLIIKRYKCGFHNIDGFWSSVDNQKDLELLNKKNNKFNYRNVEKLRKYLIK